MAVFTLINPVILGGTAWSVPATAPGLGQGVTVAGTITAGVDYSAMITEISIAFDAEKQDYTNMASAGWVQSLGGLASGMIGLKFNQDFAASQTDATFGLGGTLGFDPASTTSKYFDVKAQGSTRSATNPSYVMQWLNLGYAFGAAVGQVVTYDASFPMTGKPGRLTA